MNFLLKKFKRFFSNFFNNSLKIFFQKQSQKHAGVVCVIPFAPLQIDVISFILCIHAFYNINMNIVLLKPHSQNP
jgi:hypothetical protein